MTTIQKQALQLMSDENIGCLLVKGFGYVWPTNIRNDFNLYGEEKAIMAAEAVVAKLEAK